MCVADLGDPAAERLAAIQSHAQSVAAQRAPAVSEPLTVAPQSPLLRVVANVTLGSLVLLVVTGVHLVFYYRPLATLSGTDQLAGGTSGVGGLAELSRQLHVFSAWLVCLGVAVWLVGRAVARRPALASAAVPVTLLLVGAGMVGRRAAWDQVVLTTSGRTGPTGFPALFADHISTIARGGAEVTASQLVGWIALHIALAFAAAMIALITRSKLQVQR